MTRRDNGTGTIYQRENGTWVGRIYLGKNTEGKPRYKSLSGKTQAEVKRKIKEYNQGGNKTEIKKISVEEYILNWAKLYKKGSIKDSSMMQLKRQSEIKSFLILVWFNCNSLLLMTYKDL